MTNNEVDQDWNQFSLEVELHLAEQLLTLLGEILPGGVVLEKNYGDLFPHELDQYQGPARLYGYFPAGMSQDIQERISHILVDSGQGVFLDRVEFSPLINQNWATAWQERYRPISVGENLAVVPTWLDNPYPNRIPIRMDPGMAFGSGTHPTTQLCLVLLEKSLKENNPGEMIDIGCGSGILSIGAVKLGVEKVLGVDIDPDAVRIAQDNAMTNGVSAAVSFREGSVKDLLDRETPSERASLVVANIIAPILTDLLNEGLAELVLPGGKIILSGILKEQLSGIINCLEGAGFVHPEQHQEGDWVGLIAEKPSVP